jgi:hypothetical protein
VAALLAAGVLACGPASAAQAQTTDVAVAVLPSDTTVTDLASAGLSVGVMSTGIGAVPAPQTFLDVSQGNRIDDALYDGTLPTLPSFGPQVPHWPQIVRRAGGAPADVVPGLLASTLLARGIESEAVPAAGSAALVVAKRDGTVGRENIGRVTLFSSGIGVVRKHATGIRGEGLLIAVVEPSPGRQTVPIGIAGRGFGGDLTSDSTRTDGYVLSTDLGPTILRRFGVPVPDEMSGETIRAEGSVDPVAIEDRAARMEAIPDRRMPVLVGCLVGWIGVAAAVSLILPALRPRALAWLALAITYLPLLLLAGAALEPPAVAEGLLAGFGAAALAAITLGLAPGWRALAIACAVTTLACAIDVIAGSGLTKLSLLGPNPGFGARFYGIGNELEALICVLVPAGVGAALTAVGALRRRGPPAAAAAFLVAGFAAALVFGAGRFGADVGAAIVLPLGAAVAAVMILGSRPSIVWMATAPLLGLAAIVLIDLVSGGDAHLTRSVIDAGGASDIADAAQRRLSLSAHDFADAARTPLFWILVALLVAGVSRRRAISSWFDAAPPARAGLLGACAAVAAGVLVNDSGATFLSVGVVALGAFVAYGWSQMPRARRAEASKRADP